MRCTEDCYWWACYPCWEMALCACSLESSCTTTLKFDSSKGWLRLVEVRWAVSEGIRYVSACVWVVGLGFSGVRGNRMIHVRRARSVRQRLTESWYGYPLTPISDQILVKGYRWSKYLLVPPRLSKHPEEDLGAGLIISGTGYAGSGSSYGNVLFV